MTFPFDRGTIFALATAPGRAGIAVIRLSGPQAAAAVQSLTGQALPPPRRLARRDFIDTQGQLIDHGLLVYFPAPHSFTGEDVVECHLHGGPAIIAAMTRALAAEADCRPAEAGEFTRRAFHHGKLDLTEIEGLADLIAAETAAQHRQAMRQFDGALGKIYEGWRQELIAIAALLEAMIDFADEADISDRLAEEALPKITALIAAIGHHLRDKSGEMIRDGYHITIAGPPNAGKSSLLNALARRDVAIVTPEAGTTRDVIEVRLDLGGYPVILADTAGLRETEQLAEREGIRRAQARAHEADLVLAMIAADQLADADRIATSLPQDRTWLLVNKIDLVQPDAAWRAKNPDAVLLSVASGEGLDRLLGKLTAQVIAAMGIRQESAPITRARHRLALRDVMARLDSAQRILEAQDIALAAEDIRLAARALSRITGHVDVEDILDRIFSEFCIGK